MCMACHFFLLKPSVWRGQSTTGQNKLRHWPHSALRRPCWQKAGPPQSLQAYLFRPCWQIPLPPQAAHWAFCLPCEQISLPPHSAQRERCLPCGQIEPPPHSTQRSRRFKCTHLTAGILFATRGQRQMSLIQAGCHNTPLIEPKTLMHHK